MKTLVKITILITTYLIIFFTTSSCIFDGLSGIKGSNNVVSESRNISSNFESIKVAQGITVYLTQENATEVNVEADDNIIDLLITEVKNNELKIYFEKNVYKAKARNVYLTTKDISQIRTSSGAQVITENTIHTNTLNLDSSSGSSIKIHIKANNVNSETSSGSNIKIEGETTILTAKSSSGSSIKAQNLTTTNASVKASSGSNIYVNTSKQLTAKASSGGYINYKGEPTNVNKNTSSGGSVSSN